jgi:hypothetical protein
MWLFGAELRDTSPEKYCDLELSGRIEREFYQINAGASRTRMLRILVVPPVHDYA